MTEGTEAARIIDRSESHSALDANPQLRRYIECFLDTFLFSGKVEAHWREPTILRIAWRCQQPYEWAQHYRLARKAGVPDQQILALRAPEPELPEPLDLLVQAADEVLDVGRITPATYERLGDLFADPGLLHEFLHLVAGYRMMATVLNTTRPSVLAAGLPVWPPDGIGPEGAPPVE